MFLKSIDASKISKTTNFFFKMRMMLLKRLGKIMSSRL